MTKNQHFVPRLYLSKFQNPSNELEVLDIKALKCLRPRGTSNICSDDFFYAIETGVPDTISQLVEEWLSRVESIIGKDLKPIIDKILDYKQIEPSEKWTLAFLMSLLWIRGPAMRNQIHSMSEQVTKWTIAQQFSILPDKTFDEYDKENGKTTSPEMREKLKEVFVNQDYELEINNALHLKNLNDIYKYANMFCFQHWTVYISKLSKKFVTSDNPVAVRFPKSKGLFRGRTFLERAHHFALTPDIFIVATESDIPPPNQNLRMKRKTLFERDERQVLDLNGVILNQAHQYVYARDKQDLEDLLAVVKWQKQYFETPEGKIKKAQMD